MKKSLIILMVSSLVASSVFAQVSTSSNSLTGSKTATKTPTPSKTVSNDPVFKAKKDKVLESITDKIEALTKAQSCVSAATTKDAFNKCKKDLKNAQTEVKKSLKTSL